MIYLDKNDLIEMSRMKDRQEGSAKELTKRKIGCILYRNIIKGYEEKSK